MNASRIATLALLALVSSPTLADGFFSPWSVQRTAEAVVTPSSVSSRDVIEHTGFAPWVVPNARAPGASGAPASPRRAVAVNPGFHPWS